MKRTLTIILALSLAVCLLAGCGGSNSAPAPAAAPEGEAQSAAPAAAAKKTMIIGDTTFNAENWEETIDPGALHRQHGAGALAGNLLGE